KDDKKWLYIETTNEKWPKIVLTRDIKRDNGRYVGPYTNAGSARKTLDIVRRVFPIRSCKREIGKKKTRPCLDFQIKMCLAPCTLDVEKQEYDELVKGAGMFLGSHHKDLTNRLKEKMKKASYNLDFERASRIRDQLKAIKKTHTGQEVVPSSKHDQDIIGINVQKDLACAQVFFVREKRIVGRKRFFLEGVKNTPVEEVVSSFLRLFYSSTQDTPKEVIIQHDPNDAAAISNWLSTKRKSKVIIKTPQKGRKKKLLEMAKKNAEFELGQCHIKEKIKEEKTLAIEELCKELNLPSQPRCVEAIDISNIGGRKAVGSLVVFKDGKPNKEDYRRYKMKTEGPNDVGMIREIVLRRYSKAEALPDLLLIDGGKGQVNAAADVLKRLEKGSVPVIGLAKEYEHIYKPGKREPVILPRASEALKLLQRIRDEAHRFAISYHKKLRTKASKSSILDDIPGVGEKRKRLILEKFGSIESVRKASLEELTEVPKITKNVAVAIHAFLNENAKG
ncbi:MAG: excinuclease ABC subunit UvrC, partial [Candidatus Hydrothermarchaeales archaeon]